MKIAFLFAASLFISPMAIADEAADEANCAKHNLNMQSQVADAQVKVMVAGMTEIILAAYKEMGIDLKAEKIKFQSPNTKVEADPDQVTNVRLMTTEILAKVDAGADSITARGVSEISVNQYAIRRNEMDKIGRVTRTELTCSVDGYYTGTVITNADSGGEIGEHDDAATLSYEIILP